MRVFVTGASGFIGSAVVPELLASGHQVVGLARSDESAAALAAAGAEVVRGGLDDLDVLQAAAADSDGVIHLAFVHDFSRFMEAAETDRRAIEALGAGLEGTGRPLAIAAGVAGVAPGRLALETDVPDAAVQGPRAAGGQALASLTDRDVRTVTVRLAPSVHDRGDQGFVPELIRVARRTGVAGYPGDGENRWASVHRRDAAVLFRLAVEQAPAGSILHGVADEGIPVREIAATIGKHLDVPVRSIAPDAAAEHFGWIGMFFGLDMAASSALTRKAVGWTPTRPGLLADLEEGHYFAVPATV